MTEQSAIKPAGSLVLSINGGSSSIKFALYAAGEPPRPTLRGKIDRIGLSGASLSFADNPSDPPTRAAIDAHDYPAAAAALAQWLDERIDLASVVGIGHRIVHGMQHTEPCRVTPELLDDLERIRPYDPEHLPGEIELLTAFAGRHPRAVQVACFDTAFHATMPRVARLLPIPRRYDAQGIRRYGFHGLSYAYLMDQLARVAGPPAAQGRVILAHLGNGASLAAVSGGRSIDTSMGFTPTGGLPMSSRTGDLDPGVAWHLMRTERLTPAGFNDLVNHQSGLLGVSETSSDMHDLLEREAHDPRAAEAVALFCYQAKKWLGGFAAALGGVDTLIFSGGIGENSSPVRQRICQGLDFLGIEIDPARNAEHAPLISPDAGRVAVRVIRTDEELMIAKIVCRMLQKGSP